MNKQFFLLLLIAILFSGCQHQQKNNCPTILVDIQSTAPFALNEISDLYDIVALETTGENYIKQVEQVFVIDSLIAVWDAQTNEIFAFNNKGKYLYSIGSKGQGPEQYGKIEDVYVDYNKKHISILDNTKQAVISYNLQGHFIKSDNIPFFAYAFKPTEKGYWLVNYAQNTDKNILIYMDKTTKQNTKGYIKSDINLTLINTNNFTEDTDGKTLFHYPNENTIYRLDENNMYPYLKIDFGAEANPFTDINTKDYQDFIKKNKYVGGIHRVFAHKDHLFFSFSKFNGVNMNAEQYNAYVSLPGLKVTVYNYDIQHSDKIGISPMPEIVGLSQGKLVYMINPNILPPKLISKINDSKSNYHLGDVEITVDSNPILVIYNLDKQH